MYWPKIAMQLWHHPCGGPCSWNLHCGVTLQGGQQLLVAIQVEQCLSQWQLLEEDQALIGGGADRSWVHLINQLNQRMNVDYFCSNVRIICSRDISLSCHRHNTLFFWIHPMVLVWWLYFRLQYDVLDDHAYTGPVIMTQVIIMAYTGEMSGLLSVQN